MSTIDTQNAKQIRDGMKIAVNMTSIDSDNAITFSSGGVTNDGMLMPNIVTKPYWDLVSITDMSIGGEGFPLDGSVDWYDSDMSESEENGKFGVRSGVGGNINLVITGDSEINALTIKIPTGDGTLSCNGIDYEIAPTVIVAPSSKTATMAFTNSNTDQRICIESVINGVSLNLTNSNITSCVLSLRSDTSAINPTWKVSDIDVSAYWQDDITSAIGNLGDKIPVTYRAGYTGDMSPERHFYLSEAVTQESNIITIKAEDSSYRLANHTFASKIMQTMGKNGKNKIYSELVNAVIQSNIHLLSKESSPSIGTNTDTHLSVRPEQTADVIIQNIMNVCRSLTFYPRFVDAGRPKIYWSVPESKWTICECDCGDLKFYVDRNFNKISSSDDDYALRTACERKNVSNPKILDKKSVTSGKKYSFSGDGYYWNLKVSNAVVKKRTGEKIVYYATNTTKKVKKKGKTKYKNRCIVKGSPVVITDTTNVYTYDRVGVSQECDPVIYGTFFQGDDIIYPNWSRIFYRSNKKVSFTWKGDPRMQPRDVFTFSRIDGTTETWTVEEITLTHEAGGTTAEIIARKGLV